MCNASFYNKEQNNCMLIFPFKSGRATGILAITSAMAIGELVVTIYYVYIDDLHDPNSQGKS